ARPTRTYHQPWHQELHATVWRLFEALGGGDQTTLTTLVPDARLRRRLPAALRAESACDAPEDGPTPRTVSVPASEERTPWELVFRWTADGWLQHALAAGDGPRVDRRPRHSGAPARRRGKNAPRRRPRGFPGARLAVEGGDGRCHHPPAQAPRRLLRLVA